MKGIYLAKNDVGPMLRTDLEEPRLRPGGVLVRMRAAPVLSYTRDVLSGKLGYLFPTPFIPGNSGVGIVESVADDVFDVKPEQWVNIDPRITAHSTSKPEEADAILIGLTASTPASAKTQNLWRNGSYAERALVPAECVTRIDRIAHLPVDKLALLSHIAVPYGGLVRGGFRAGQTVIINGATGMFGARAVVMALAMGASRVIAAGRDKNALAALTALDEKRVFSAVISGSSPEERSAKLQSFADDWGIDLYLDMLGRAQEPDSILACLGALRHRGTAVFMGGVRIAVPIPYADLMRKELTIIGNFMYARSAVRELVAMIACGALNLNVFNTNSFPIEAFERALDRAETSKGLDSVCVTID